MAFIQCNFASECIGIQTQIYAVIPEDNNYKKINYPVLYLLHGLSDNNTMWMRKTSIERYASEKGIAVIIPDVHRSFYTNTKYGMRYWDYVSDELIKFTRKMFPISEEPNYNYVAGLSMGGYGAFKLALRKPHLFSKAASLSGALNVLGKYDYFDENKELLSIFGSKNEFNKNENDLFTIIDNNINKNIKMPDLYQCCGTEDFLYSDNIKFRDFCLEKNMNLKYEESSGGHSWEFWDTYIKKIVDWL